MSNAERQRRFCESHPGYYRKYSAQRIALNKAAKEKFLAEWRARDAAAKAQAASSEPLMLPAPVETIEIPGMTTIDAIPTREELAQLRETTAAHALAKDLPA